MYFHCFIIDNIFFKENGTTDKVVLIEEVEGVGEAVADLDRAVTDLAAKISTEEDHLKEAIMIATEVAIEEIMEISQVKIKHNSAMKMFEFLVNFFFIS